MIILSAFMKRLQSGPFGKDGKPATILTMEWQEQNMKTGRVQDRVSDFYIDQGHPGTAGLSTVKEGEPISVEVRPWVSGKDVRFEFVRFLGKSGKP